MHSKNIFHFNKSFEKICVHLRNTSDLTIKSNFLGNILLEEKGVLCKLIKVPRELKNNVTKNNELAWLE